MTTFRFSENIGQSLNFIVGSDVLAFSTLAADATNGGSAAQLQFVVSGADLLISLGGSAVRLLGVTQAQLTATNLTFDDGSLFRPGTAGVDNLTGGAGNDYFSASASADTMAGLAGDDLYIVDDTGDVINESSGNGNDSVRSSATYTLGANVENLTLTGISAINATGNTSNNVLVGNSAANVLNGGTGADSMSGGDGNDTYVVDDAGDTVTEQVSQGTDVVQSSVTFTLGNDVENLVLTGTNAINGTGNALANSITGNSGANTLDGGGGVDSMAGGAGNDIYIVDNLSDTVTEAAGEGTDEVRSSVTHALGANFENLTLTGTTGTNATGNTLNNVLTGNSGSNTIDGGAGADTMAGGGGNDIYVVDNAGDTVTEAAAEGTDLVQSSVTFTLGSNIENLTLTGTGTINATGNDLANVLTGNSGANVLVGGDGNDTLNGGAGADAMGGGLGNDTYVVDNVGDVVVENEAEGTDSVQSSVTFTLASNVENLTLTGAGSIDATGNALNNALVGNTGNNVLNGGAGADNMNGGAGNDTYIVDNIGDVVADSAATGTDVVQSSVSFTLTGKVENLFLTGTSEINATGNELNNIILGNSAANTINGGAGADQMTGGGGNDIYVVDNAGDVVTEGTNAGTDLVQSSITYTLGANVDNLTLTGTGEINGTGNDLANVLTGNTAANILVGGGGNDTLNGGAGADTMTGGLGNDTYVVDNVGDSVTEAFGEGTDLVQSVITYTLGTDLDNLTLTGGQAINGTGNSLDNVLTGNTGNNILTAGDGNDTLDGGLGSDTLVGGAGNDTYVVNVADDVVTEDADAGTDVVNSSVTYTLGANIENLTLTGSANVNATGNTLNNTVRGNGGNNVLNGGTGTDTLIGGLGDDTYLVDGTDDVLTEAASAGTDTVQTGITYTLATNFENLTLTGSANVNGTGNSVANVLTGNSGANVLNGGLGADTMLGGAGNDTYVVDDGGDVVTELAGAGTDLVQSSISYTLGTNVENLTLTGAGAINGTGNELANVLTGNTGANILTGAEGNDTLNGGAGADTLIGGVGNDTYVVDNVGDVVTENASEGTDLVQASVNFTLSSDVENLTLTGAAVSGTGNTLNNVITGNGINNSLNGGDGNDTLDGGAGSDTLTGGTGNDIYVVDVAGDVIVEAADEGTDLVNSSVNHTLSANVENLTLTGVANINGIGNTLNNVITGNSGNNTLNGGTGVDTLVGGMGDDTYLVDGADDVVTEATGAGTDTVQTSVSYTLGTNVENLILGGSSDINGTGNTLANVLTGNNGANVLNGGTGADTMSGAAGNDSYVVDDAGDVVIEASVSGGNDLVTSSINYALTANVENLTLTGSAVIGTGNELNNVLTGNAAANTLNGGDGNDTLNGGVGSDTMVGGLGNDTYVVDAAGDITTEAVGEGTDLVQSSVTYTIGANVENLTLTGTGGNSATGNALNNVLTGNTGANVLNGLAGADTMIGGTGNDTYVVDDAGDVVTEANGAGTDLVQSSISHTLAANVENLTLTGSSNIDGFGNGLANTLTGNGGNNLLDGGTGADTMVGGLGNDTYVVDNAADIITEGSSAGTDLALASISYTLASNVENLTLTGMGAINGTGNALANVITGNDGNNVLNGGGGVDTLIGGLGNDTYVLDGATEVVTEAATAGTDTVQIGVTYTLGANVENLTLTGSGAVNGFGNELNNVLTGNTGNNLLDGGTGADTMVGGAGNDTYVLNSGDDVITEAANGGTDTVQASLAGYTLGLNLENLTLIGTDNIGGFGNAMANVMTGNSGNNRLDGGAGTDSYAGGLGDDTYVLDSISETVTEAASAGSDTVEIALSYTLGTNVENLLLTGVAAINGTGNVLNNLLIGNAAANTLNGAAGADTMAGAGGNDIYIVDNAGDVVSEHSSGDGTDLVQSSVTYSLALSANVENLTLTGSAAINGTGNELANVLTGNTGANTLTGGAGNDTLNGGSGNDTMVGGLGDDTFIVDSTSDVVTESAEEGTDLVQSSVTYTLSANVENLTLTGVSVTNATGNALANILTGNSGANTLNGLGGADTMIGGAGNDTYVVDDAGDVVTEGSSAGTDSVQSSISHTLAANVENLILTGVGNTDATGNDLANVLTGNSGNNILTGGAGMDTFVGGLGNDTYVLDSASETVTENSSAGIDTVQIGVSYTIGTNIENLTLTGSAAANGTGNAAGNVLVGNDGANVLQGLGGTDTLTGGAGADTFKFAAYTDSAIDGLRDVITDFSSAQGDKIDLSMLDAMSGTTGDQAFTFIGSAEFTAAGQLRFQDGVLYASNDADAIAEFSVALTGVASLSESDFVL